MRRKERHWAVLPGIVVATLAAVGALGTAIVKSATYIGLPDRVEATERKNESQDKQLDRLITLQEYYAQRQQQQVPSQAKVWMEHEDQKCWQCTSDNYQECWTNKLWRICE